MAVAASPKAIRRAARSVWLAGIVSALVVAGCEEGKAPYQVSPGVQIPPEGVAPGTTRSVGQIYHFDPLKYRLFRPTGDTDPHYIKRDSVLAVVSAGNPGAPLDMLIHPDHYDATGTLTTVYDNPALFGFEPAGGSGTGFKDGRVVDGASQYWPIQPGNSWSFDHNSLEWSYTDSIEANAVAGRDGASVTRMATTCAIDPAPGNPLRALYIPNGYQFETEFTVTAGDGIVFHAWDLISERVVRPPHLPGDPTVQRNPRSLWMSLAASADPQAPIPVTVDQCVDELPSHLELAPLRLCQERLQEGETYTTWTYLTINDADLRQRLNTEAQVVTPRGGRCGIEVVTQGETLRMFPTRSYRLLCRFDVSVARVVDQVVLKFGESVAGRYPRTAAPNEVVELQITMSVGTLGGIRTPVQFMELWLQKDLGPVIRDQGVSERNRSRSRLFVCTVGGMRFRGEDPSSPFEYHRNM